MKSKTLLLAISSIFCTFLLFGQSSFTPGRIVAVQTTGATTKFGSAVTLKEYTPSGVSGVSVTLPITGINTIQMAATLGGSEGFLTQSSDGANLILGGYSTSADYSSTDITASNSATVPRAIYKIDASGNFSKVYSSTTYYSANDIRGGVSDGTNYWTSGASVANVDGINYFGPSTAAVLGGGATPIKAYGLRIFGGQMYCSTQKAGPSNTTSHLGIFSVGTGLPISGSPTLTQVIDMGTTVPADFSFNTAGTICYVAVNLNTAAGGIQKWTKSGATWTLQYTLGTGVSNIGAYGLVVDYSGANPVIYATTSEATVGNRIIKITDTGSGSSASTLVAATTNVWFHGVDFAPCVAPAITSVTSSSVCADNTLNLNLSTTGTSPLTHSWTGPNGFTSSSQNPSISSATTAATGSYSITVSNGCGTSTSSVTGTVNALPTATITPSGATTFCSGNSITLTASSGSSYLWSTGETTQAITVSTSGSFSVTVTNASNCSATSSATTVTVNPTVVPSVSIASDLGTSVCPGATVTFTATPTNGGTASYQWKLNGNIVSTDNAVFSTNSLLNSDVVTCILISSDACVSPSIATSNSLTMVVSLPQQPADFTVKNTFVYKGEMGVVYTVPNVSGVTYNWTYSGTGETINGSGNSVTIDFSSIATSGTLSVTANNVACGSSTARTVAINLNNSITIPQTNLDYSFVTVGCNRVDYTDTSATTGLDVATGKSTANVYQLKRLFTEISHISPLPKYLFLTGDIVMGYKGVADTAELVKQLTSWKAIYQSHPLSSMNITLVAIPGNHETQNKAAGKTSYVEAERIYTRVMAPYINGSNGPGVGGADNLATDQSKLTYSFNYGQDHFIVLNTDPTGQDSKVPFHWVANDVQTARANNARHIFAFGHKPAYSSSMKPGDGLENSGSVAYVAQRDSLWKYLENNNCEAMFAAHEHCWDTIHPHAGKTWQVVAGNGGSRVETLFMGAGKQYLGYTLVNLYTDRKVNVMGLGRDADMGTGVGNLFSKNEDFNPTSVRANFNICLTTKSTNTVTVNDSYSWNGTNYTNSGTYTYTTTNAAGCDSIASLALTVTHLPSQPADFTVSSSTVIYGQSGVAYTVPNDPSVTYSWSYSGTGATIIGSGNSITINFASNATAGNLSVYAINSYGNSIPRSINITLISTDFTPGRIVVLQTTGSVSKSSNSITLKEYTVTGVPGVTVNLPSTGTTPIQTAGVYGGSEGFLTNSTDGKYLVVAGYGTSSTFADVTATASNTVPRVIGQVTPSGLYQQMYSSSTMFNLNDIRSAVSDGTNYWVGGASTANVDGINYVGPGTPTVLGSGAIPSKAYATRIFNNQIYYSTQKAGPSNSATQLGIFSIGSGLQTSGTATPVQIINTGSIIPEDFSFNSSLDVCYIAVNLNTASGGIQKWTKSAGTWTLAYTLSTGAANIGAYGLLVDYSGANPIIYATTFETTGNRVIKIADSGPSSNAFTIVPAVAGVYYKGIAFSPVSAGTPTVNLSVSSNAGSEAGTTAITVTATSSSTLSSTEIVSLAVTGTNITNGDFTLSNSTIIIPSGASSGSVTFTVVDDVLMEGNEIAVLTISNPSPGLLLGTTTSQNVVISDNDNSAPTIFINVASTTNYIDGGVASSPVSPYTISGSIGDVTDPIATLGIDFIINDAETAASSLIVTVASSNITVVPNGNMLLTGSLSIRNLKISPIAVGYSTITIQVSDGLNNASYVINYAASDSIPKIVLNNTQWHTGMSDASDAISLDNDYYMTADDEVDVINVYSRHNSGLPVASFNYASYLNLPDQAKPEVDAEASAKSYKIANRYYWLGSMSNGKDPFDNKPNRDRLFATTVTGTGAATTISVNGYTAIRSALLTWGDAHGYNFTASAAAGVDSKSVSGFAAEGMVFGPDSTTLWIGLRAPLVPTVNRTKAVIAPILNFETWFNNGSQVGNPTFGAPIELNLGGKGIRDIIRLENGTYIIVAGDAGPNLALSSIYKWTGNSADSPILVSSQGNGKLNMEGVMEVKANGITSMSQLQVISDGGSDVIYNDGLEAKDYGNLNLRKFRSDILTGIDLCMPVSSAVNAVNSSFCGGSSTTLTAPTIPNPSSFIWTNGSTSKSIVVSNFGNYSVTQTDLFGCIYNSSTILLSNCEATDLTDDGVTDINDFLIFAPAFGFTCSNCREDINHDGSIDINDFLLFAPKFNRVCSCN